MYQNSNSNQNNMSQGGGLTLPDLSNVDIAGLSPMAAMQQGATPQKKSWGSAMVNNVGISYFSGLLSAGALGLGKGYRGCDKRLPWRIKSNQMLNHCSKIGSTTGNKFGVLALLYTSIKHFPAQWVPLDFDDDQLSIFSATCTGMLYKIGSQQRIQILRYGGLGFALSSAFHGGKWILENY